MMDFDISADHPINQADIDLIMAKCMAWLDQKYHIAQLIGGRMLMRRNSHQPHFCCVKCFHAEQLFEFRTILPAEEIPKGQGWMIIELHAQEFTNRRIDA